MGSDSEKIEAERRRLYGLMTAETDRADNARFPVKHSSNATAKRSPPTFASAGLPEGAIRNTSPELLDRRAVEIRLPTERWEKVCALHSNERVSSRLERAGLRDGEVVR